MEGLVKNFRRARHSITMNQIIINVKGVDSKEKASALSGKKVVFKTGSGKELHGVIMQSHGSNGAVRARFTKGLPGQILGSKVEIL